MPFLHIGFHMYMSTVWILCTCVPFASHHKTVFTGEDKGPLGPKRCNEAKKKKKPPEIQRSLCIHLSKLVDSVTKEIFQGSTIIL